MNLQPVKRPDADIPHMLPFGEGHTKVMPCHHIKEGQEEGEQEAPGSVLPPGACICSMLSPYSLCRFSHSVATVRGVMTLSCMLMSCLSDTSA